MTPDTEFERLLSEGLGIDVTRHWGAGFLEGRYVADRPSSRPRTGGDPHRCGPGSGICMLCADAMPRSLWHLIDSGSAQYVRVVE